MNISRYFLPPARILCCITFCVTLSLLSHAQNTPHDEDALAVAQRAFVDGLYSVALRHTENVRARLPDGPLQQEAILLQARCLLALNNLSNSIVVLQEIHAERADPDVFTEAQYWMGHIYEREGNIPKALFAYETAATAPDVSLHSAMAAGALSRLFVQRGEYERAREMASNIIIYAHTAYDDMQGEGHYWLAQIAYVQNDFLTAADYCRTFLDKGITNAMTPYISLAYARSLFHAGDRDTAQLLSDILASAPDIPQQIRDIAHYYRGKCALHAAQTNIALEAFSQVPHQADAVPLDIPVRLLQDPEGFPYADALAAHARIAYALNDIVSATEAYAAVYHLYPDSRHAPHARLGHALCLLHVGERHSATQLFARVADVDDPAISAAALLAWANAERESHRYSTAINLYGALASVATGVHQQARAHFDRGMCYFTIGHYATAAKAFADAFDIYPHPDGEDALIWRAWAYVHADDMAAAHDVFTQYTDTYPKGTWVWNAHLQRAHIAIRDTRYADARTILQALETNTAAGVYAVRAAAELGWLYLRKGKTDNAIAQFTKCITLYPRSPITQDMEFHLGEIHMNARDYSRAYSTFSRLIARQPDGPRAGESVYWAALAAYRMRNITDAFDVLTSHWEKVAASPRVVDAYLLRGDCLRSTSSLTNAIEIYDHIAHHFSNSYRAIDAQFRSAEVARELGDVTRAESLYRHILTDAHARHRARAHLGLGDVLADQGKLRDAIGQWLHVIYDYREFTTLFNDAIDRAGSAYEYLGEASQAQVVYNLRGSVEPRRASVLVPTE